MNSVQALIRRAERDVAVTTAVRKALESMRLIHQGRIQIEDTGLVIDLAEDIQRLGAVLMLMGYPGEV